MNDLEKARDIAKDYSSVELPTHMIIEESCLEMAQWKDEQYKEQKKLTWKEIKYIIELDGNIETDNFMGSDEYYQAIANKANVVLFGLQGNLD